MIVTPERITSLPAGSASACSHRSNAVRTLSATSGPPSSLLRGHSRATAASAAARWPSPSTKVRHTAHSTSRAAK